MTRQTRMAYLSEDVTNHAVKQFIICSPSSRCCRLSSHAFCGSCILGREHVSVFLVSDREGRRDRGRGLFAMAILKAN